MNIHAPEMSADGKRNAYHVHCHLMGHYRPYAACLNLCNRRKDGRLNAIYADCSAAIGKKSCPALSMRQEEKEAGRAIYFVERIRHLGDSFMEKAREFAGIASKPEPSKSTPSHKSSVIDRIDTGDYSTAINAAVQESKTEIPAAPEVKVEVKKGESILEMARRLMAQQQSKE